MPDKAWYRDPDQLRAAVEKHGSLAGAARATGTGHSTLKDWWKRHGLEPRPNQNLHRDGSGFRKTLELGSPVSREELLEDEVKVLRAQVAKTRELEVFEHKALRLIEDTIAAKDVIYTPAPRVRDGEFTEHEFVLLWSDLHAAEVVSAEEMHNLNAYDWRIMLERHEQMRQALLSFKDNRPYPVRQLHIVGLGDMLSGDIHDELKVTNELVLAEATVQLGLDMAEWIEGFVPHFRRIKITGVVGNHPRLAKKPQAKKAYDNFDWIMYQILKQRLAKYDTVEVVVPRSSQALIDVFDRRLLAFHGDGIRSTMPGVPWGGVSRRVAELQNQFSASGMPIDYFALGHFHTANIVETSAGRVFMNGSVKGPDEYSVKQFGSARKAQQLLLTFHPTRGITDVSFLDLQKRDPKHA